MYIKQLLNNDASPSFWSCSPASIARPCDYVETADWNELWPVCMERMAVLPRVSTRLLLIRPPYCLDETEDLIAPCPVTAHYVWGMKFNISVKLSSQTTKLQARRELLNNVVLTNTCGVLMALHFLHQRVWVSSHYWSIHRPPETSVSTSGMKVHSYDAVMFVNGRVQSTAEFIFQTLSLDTVLLQLHITPFCYRCQKNANRHSISL